MAAKEVELFDLASKDGNVCWSPNPWKARLALNLKKIPYRTTFVEYPDIAPTLKALDIPPNTEGFPYTIPAARLPDGTCVMESKSIAAALEKLQPSPSLHLDAPVLSEAEALVPKVIGRLRPIAIPKVPRNLLNPSSEEYFNRTRLESFGRPLPEVEKIDGGEKALKEAEPGIKELGELLKKQGGPFFLGETISFADLIFIGALQFYRRVGEGLFEQLVSIEPALGKLYDAGKSLLERDNH